MLELVPCVYDTAMSTYSVEMSAGSEAVPVEMRTICTSLQNVSLKVLADSFSSEVEFRSKANNVVSCTVPAAFAWETVKSVKSPVHLT
jgi:hypothetical protein